MRTKFFIQIMSHKEESDTQRLVQRVLQQSFSSFSISKMDLEGNSETVIDAHIFPALINILQTAEFRTRKEAAWAITNATSGGYAEQI
ncbi:unnamed protein product, partial [Eretmochelys imbricata]